MAAARFRPTRSFFKYFRVEKTSIKFPARTVPSVKGAITLEKAQIYVILYSFKRETRDKRAVHGPATSLQCDRRKEYGTCKVPSADIDYARASRKTYSLYFAYRGAPTGTRVSVSRNSEFVESFN